MKEERGGDMHKYLSKLRLLALRNKEREGRREEKLLLLLL